MASIKNCNQITNINSCYNNTEEITVQDLKEEIEKAEEKLEWPWQDSGIEQTI